MSEFQVPSVLSQAQKYTLMWDLQVWLCVYTQNRLSTGLSMDIASKFSPHHVYFSIIASGQSCLSGAVWLSTLVTSRQSLQWLMYKGISNMVQKTSLWSCSTPTWKQSIDPSPTFKHTVITFTKSTEELCWYAICIICIWSSKCCKCSYYYTSHSFPALQTEICSDCLSLIDLKSLAT